MAKAKLIKTLWSAFQSDENDVKHEALEIALREIAGDEGFETLCAIDAGGDDVGVALDKADEDTEAEPDGDMVEALIRNATS